MTVTRTLPGDDPRAIQEAVTLLLEGRLVAFPTDTVYGLGALVDNPDSIARIYQAKERPAEKAIPILLASLDAARRLVGELPEAAEVLARRFWPGALTLVVPCGNRVPEYVTSGNRSVALRVPNHAVTLRLLSRLGQPLAVTSANRSGHESPLTAEEVLEQLSGRIDAVLDGGNCPGGLPSTVLSLVTLQPQLLRAGPIDFEELNSALRDAGVGVREVI